MMNKEIIVDGVDVSDWTDEEVRYKFEKQSPKAIRQIAFDLYKQLARKEQECKEINLKNERLVAEKYTMNEEILKLKQALDEIGKLIPKFESSDGCDYGDFDCENCSDLDEDTVCAYKLKKVIKGIINKVKEEINEES